MAKILEEILDVGVFRDVWDGHHTVGGSSLGDALASLYIIVYFIVIC